MPISKVKNLPPDKIFQEIIQLLDSKTLPENEGRPSQHFSFPLRDPENLLDMMPGVVCVLDIDTQGYLYIGKNAAALGYSIKEVYSKGLQYTIGFLHENHQRILLEDIMPVIMERFFEYGASGLEKEVVCSYPTLMRHKNGELRWYLHTLRIFALDELKRPKLLFKILSDINDIKKDELIEFVFYRKDEDGNTEILWKKVFHSDVATTEMLTSREKEILELLRDGLNTSDIANKLFLSEHTVSNHRKNMLKKMDAKNTLELIQKARQLKILG